MLLRLEIPKGLDTRDWNIWVNFGMEEILIY